MTTKKVKEYNNARKYKYWKLIFMSNTNVKLDKNTLGETILLSGWPANGWKKYQGGLMRAWNAFLLNVFEWERENSNSKPLFYKDCSLGSVKNLSNN